MGTPAVKTMDSAELRAVREELAEREEIIGQAQVAFLDAGAALQRIAEGRLYIGGYSTFENYVWQRWDFSEQRAYQLIDAARVARLANSTNVESSKQAESGAATVRAIPSEAVARELVTLKKEPERLRAVWSAFDSQAKPPKAWQVKKLVKLAKDAPLESLGALLRKAVALLEQVKEPSNAAVPSQNGVPYDHRPETSGEQHTNQFLLTLAFLAKLDPEVTYGAVPQHAWDQLEQIDLAMKHLARIKRLWVDDRNG